MIVRKLGYNSSSKESIRVTLPKEFNWNAGEIVKFEKIDEDTIIIQRLKDNDVSSGILKSIEESNKEE